MLARVVFEVHEQFPVKGVLDREVFAFVRIGHAHCIFMVLVRVQPVQLLLGHLPVRGDHEVNVVGLLVMGSTGCLGLPFNSVYMSHFFPVNDLMLQVLFDDSSE